MKKIELVFIVIVLVLGCKNAPKANTYSSTVKKNKTISTEKYRPQHHFTPKTNWMNDPNGLVYYNGNYHLFYQYYPDSTVWGPMHWGHAKSKDLLQWEHRSIALYPDSLGYIFSGSAVIDKQNSAGFGKNTMVAVYTYHDPVAEKAGNDQYQSQGIAYSLDEGETWVKYQNNPVVKNPGIKDFRDPKVFWNKEKAVWQMVLVAKDHVQIYESKNLKAWNKISEFRFEENRELGVWECPDLFKLKVNNEDEEKWVLIVSHGGESAPNGGSGTRYFVGDYDGTTFTTDQKESQWLDYGTDNYAGVTYNDTPTNKRIFIGWMSNWNYATVTPTKSWRSAMTLPRELQLMKSGDNYLVKSKLIDGFENMLSTPNQEHITGTYPHQFKYEYLQSSSISFDATIEREMQVNLFNEKGDELMIGYRKDDGMFYLDRGRAGVLDFSEKYKESSYQTMEIGHRNSMNIHVVLDASSIEVFINEGEYVMTAQIFTNEPLTSFLFDQKKGGAIKNFSLKHIKRKEDGYKKAK